MLPYTELAARVADSEWWESYGLGCARKSGSLQGNADFSLLVGPHNTLLNAYQGILPRN